MTFTRRVWTFSALALMLILSACTSTGSTPDTVSNTAPTVSLSATPSTGTAPYSSVLTANASDPEGDALSYTWVTPEGAVTGSNTFSYTMTTPGTYPVSVNVSDGSSTTVQSVNLTATAAPVVPGNHAPIVSSSATPKSGDAPLTVSFSAQGSDLDGDALSFIWSFGDGGGASGQSVSHTYTKAGSYKAKVTVSDGHGGSDSASQTVKVGGETKPGPVEGEGTVKLDVTPNGSAWTLGGQSGTGDTTVKIAAGAYTLAVSPPANSPFTATSQSVTVEANKVLPLETVSKLS